MHLVPSQGRAALMQLRTEMLAYLELNESDADFCGRCHLPLPADDYEAYDFCPWCDQPLTGGVASDEPSRRIIEHQWGVLDDVQCGECGGEYSQPSLYPFIFCPACGASFDEGDELLIELPFLI